MSTRVTVITATIAVGCLAASVLVAQHQGNRGTDAEPRKQGASRPGTLAYDAQDAQKERLISPEARKENERSSGVARASCSGFASRLAYPFENDGTWAQAMSPNDDGSVGPITLPFTFPLYGDDYTRCWINNNGNLSFDGPYYYYTAAGFPSTSYVMVAPFWGDVDTRSQDVGTGLIWYKWIDSDGDGNNETFVVTWDNVGYYSEHTDKLNTFQVAISDGRNADMGLGNTVCFSYDNMCWTTGDASGGSGGFGGVPATVGCNRGNGTDFFQIGRFDHAGTDHDGPFGSPDGVNWLEGEHLCINTGSTGNIPPVPQGFPAGNLVAVAPEIAEVLDLTVQFLSPEEGQITTVAIGDPDGAQSAGLTVESTAGNVAAVHLTWPPSCSDSGAYVLEFTASDDFEPPGVTEVSLTINVGTDCNNNGYADGCDIAEGASEDCNNNGVPDECEPDCQPNGMADNCDIDLGQSQDCNANGVPDECDIAGGASDDCQPNGIPDECEWAAYLSQPLAGREGNAARSNSSLCQFPDQQQHGGAFMVLLDWDLGSVAADSFTFTEPSTITGVTWWGTYQDECGEPCAAADDFTLTFYLNDGGPASVVVTTYNPGGAVTRSATGQTIPLGPGFAEYEYSFALVPPLSVGAGQRHWVEIRNNTAASCMWWWETAPEGANANGTSLYDAAGDGYDASDLAPYDLAFCVSGLPAAEDCNGNGVNDAQDILDGTSQDCQPNGIPDECEDDRNYNGIPDTCDIVGGVSKDLNFNGVPDEAECLTTPGDFDGDCDVELDDYALLAACIGAGGADILAGCVCADFDLNGIVDFDDYLAFSTVVGQPVIGCTVPLADACPDSWTTGGPGRSETFYDFGAYGPIPAGFFGEGSDPFGEIVALIGTPADPNGVYGDIDTQIQHGPVIFDPETGEAQTALDIITLELISKDPITVTYNGGQNPEQWLVVAGLSAHDPGSGELTATLDDPDANSGTYDATVYVQPAFLFVKLQDLIDHVLPECVDVRALDTGASGAARTGMPPITLTFTGEPFVRTADPSVMEQVSVAACAQGNFVPGVVEAGGGGRAVQEFTCTGHITEGEAHYFCPPECEEEKVCQYTAMGPGIGLCLQFPSFPDAVLGQPCPNGQCSGFRVKHKPCLVGIGMARRFYWNPSCKTREERCKGACCSDQGGCTLSTNALCDGTYMLDGTDCVLTGACHRLNDPCVNIPQFCCAAAANPLTHFTIDDHASVRQGIRDGVLGHLPASSESIVIVLGGKDQDPVADLDEGVFQIALELEATSGYTVFTFDEDGVESDGSGAVYNLVVNLIQNQAVTKLAIFGYSHGGGSTHDLVKHLDDTRAAIGAFDFDIEFTAYIDAIGQDFPYVWSETRFPPSSAFHLNYYQTHLPLRGNAVAGAENVDATAQGWIDTAYQGDGTSCPP